MTLQTIKKNTEFRRIYQKKQSEGNSLLILYLSPMRLDSPRVGITVSGKVGNAVVRNRIKRRIKEILRQNLSAVCFGYDIIFVARPACRQASYSELLASCLKLMRKAVKKRHGKGC